MSARIGSWAVCEPSQSTVGRVLSVHRTKAAADRAARRVGGEVEYADLVARVQSGQSYTEALQSLAGTDILPARVEVP